MGLIDIVDVEALRKEDPTLWVQNGRGLLVVCENGQESDNVVKHMRTNCKEVSGGLETQGGSQITIYEERNDIAGVEFIFMLPVDMSVDLAIGDIQDQLRPFLHVT
jgi:hypothetical protein